MNIGKGGVSIVKAKMRRIDEGNVVIIMLSRNDLVVSLLIQALEFWGSDVWQSSH